MDRRRWLSWAGGFAVALGMAAAGPAEGAWPPAPVPAAASTDLEEAKRLAADVERLETKGKYDEALPLAERALAIREKALGAEHPLVASSLGSLANLYWDKTDYGHAEPLYQRALAIREKALGPDHPDVAGSLNDLADLYRARGEYERSRALVQRALAIREKALGPDHASVAESLNSLAELFWETADYAHAEPLFRRALAIREKVLGPDHLDVAVSASDLADVYGSKGDYARAEPLYRRALAIREKALGPGHPDVARSLDDLAELDFARGDYGRAEPLFQRALSIQEKALGPDHRAVARSLNDLAAVRWAAGDYGRAEPLFQRVLAIREKALGPDHPSVAAALSNLAALFRSQGDQGRAEALQRRALAIQEKAFGPDHPDVGSSLNKLALVYQTTGDDGRAEPLHRRALAIREKALGPDHPDVAQSLNNLAKLYLAEGRLPEALNAARKAADIQDRHATVVLATGSENQKRLYTSTLVADTSWDLSLHVQHAPTDPDAARLALTVLLRRKGRVLDAMTDSLAALRRSLTPGDQEVLDRLASTYARFAALVSRGPGQTPPEQYRKDLAALEQEREALEADVGRRSAAFHTEQHLVTLPEVQAKIPAGAALVEIARYTPLDIHPGSPARRVAPRYAAYLLGPSGDPTFADLGEAAPLEAAVDTFRRALGDPDRTHDPRPAARALDHLLMEPIRALLGETRWVFLSPDGALNLVPFGALVDPQGRYLVTRYLFSYLTAGRDLLRFGDEHPAPREAPLILANPAFGDSTALAAPEATHREVRSLDMVTHALLQLGSTAEEARAIARLFPDSRVLTGARATEEAVEAVHGPRFLHLATHGFFLPEQAVPEALLHGPGAEPTPAERAALLQRESPLLRSGVALAGFNRRGNGSNAGVLTALTAAGLDLHGTRLVVLSTCESGLGEASVGEGVYGMRRALTMAGAETQVMSLWQVDTGRTRELMEAYYRRLQEGAGRSEAMRAVQLAMLAERETASPNLWASFIVSGEWRSLSGASRLPEVGRVEPGARGCACEQTGGAPSGHVGWVAVALALAARRRRARRG